MQDEVTWERPAVRQAVDLDALREELDLWSSAHLAAPERPRAFTLGAALPSNPLGKVIDWALD
jgi:long-chain acyl-CoA synthetase